MRQIGGGCVMTHGSEPAFQRGAYSAPMQKAPWASRRCMLHEFLGIWRGADTRTIKLPPQLHVEQYRGPCLAARQMVAASQIQAAHVGIPSSPMSFKALPLGALAKKHGSKILQDMGTGRQSHHVIQCFSQLLTATVH